MGNSKWLQPIHFASGVEQLRRSFICLCIWLGILENMEGFQRQFFLTSKRVIQTKKIDNFQSLDQIFSKAVLVLHTSHPQVFFTIPKWCYRMNSQLAVLDHDFLDHVSFPAYMFPPSAFTQRVLARRGKNSQRCWNNCPNSKVKCITALFSLS